MSRTGIAGRCVAQQVQSLSCETWSKRLPQLKPLQPLHAVERALKTDLCEQGARSIYVDSDLDLHVYGNWMYDDACLSVHLEHGLPGSWHRVRWRHET